MNEDTVIGNDPTQPGVPATGQGKDDYVPLTRAQAESLQRERDESRASERAWADIARSGRQAAPPEPVSDLPDANEFLDPDDTATGLEGDTPEKFVDDFASHGSKALHDRGFVTKAEAQRMATEAAIKVSNEMIGRQAQRNATDQAILTEFADLKDQTSDLYKETAVRYQRVLKMDPSAAKTPAALYLAAEGARDYLAAQKAARPRDDDEREEDRRARADSQDARPRGRGQAADPDDMLGPEARELIKSFGLTDEQFKASQKEYARPARGRR